MIGNAVWFEIPASDFERAVKFYEAVFQVSLRREKIGGDLAVFPGDDPAVTGAIVSQEGYLPAANGPVVYLSAGNDLNPMLERVVAQGGNVVLPKTALPPGMGHYAHFMDCEGNRVGLHSGN